MTPSEFTDPQAIPYPPVDIPVPDLPPANFVQIGMQLEQGRQAAAAGNGSKPGVIDWIADLIARIVVALLNCILTIVAFVMKLIYQVWGAAEGGTDQVAAAAIQGMFGTPVSSGSFSSVLSSSQREGVAGGIASTIFGALGGSFTGASAQPLGPSMAGANKYLSLTTHMAIEGWLQGWLAELLSAGVVKDFADLKDIMERTLGLGRLARQVMGPAAKILVADPLTWQLNQTYFPTLLKEPDLVREYLRGAIELPALQTKLGYLGYSTDNVAALINLNKVHLGVGQLENLAMHGNISDADAQAALKALGYDDNTAASALFDARTNRVDGWERAVIAEAMALYVDGKMDLTEWGNWLSNSGLPQSEQQVLGLVAGLKQRQYAKRISMGEAEQLVEVGLWGLDQFHDLAIANGYSETDEEYLELLLAIKTKKAADATAAKAAAASAKAAKAAASAKAAAAKAALAHDAAEAKGVTLAQYAALVKDGLRTVADYAMYLNGKGLAPDNVATLTQLLQQSLSATAAAGGVSATAAATVKAKNLSLAQLETAVQDGILTMGEYQQRIEQAGVSAPDAAILVQLLTDKVATAAAKAQALAAAKAAKAAKHPSLAEYEKFAKLGIITVQQFQAALEGLGYDEPTIALFMQENGLAAAATAAAVAATPATGATAKGKGPVLADVERAVRAGLETMDQYTAALAAAGYTADAIALKVALLQLLMQQDQATLAASGRAASLIGKRGLSLADIERAVKLNIIPISTYTATLKAAGVDDADANTLTLILSAGVAQTGQTQATKAAATKALAQVGLSLPTIEKDILDGKLAVDQLAGVLAGAGLDQTDAAAVTGLVSAQVTNQRAVAALVGGVAAAASSKNLSLAQETAAVKAGVKTIEDYQTFVAALGYSPADVATLVATEAAALGVPVPAATAAPPLG